MNLTIDFWSLAGFLLSILASFVGMARWLASEYDRRQELRFADFRAHVEEADLAITKSLARHLDEEARASARVGDHAERISRLEEAVRRMPSHDDIKAIHARLDTLATKTDTMQGQIPGLVDNVRLILNILKRG